MKYSINEFNGYSIEDIREFIEGEPEVATHKVLPGHTPEKITGMNTEDSVPGEGDITFDIRFYAILPGGEHIELIINVEAQKSFYPGYDLVTRAVFYCARLLSAQCGTEFTPRNYDDIKKVYSIWICMDVPKKMEYKITKYRMAREDVYGSVPDESRYALLEVVMVYFSRKAEAAQGSRLHGLLSTLLSDDLKPNEKKEILKQEYGIATSVEMEGGLQKMCNLSEMIEEKGFEQGIEKSTLMTLISLVNDGLLSEEDAAKRSGVSAADFKAFLEEQNKGLFRKITLVSSGVGLGKELPAHYSRKGLFM